MSRFSAIGTNEGYQGATSTSVIGGTFDNITVFNDTTSALNTLTGPALATTWTISSTASAGTVSDNTSSQSMAYTNFPNLVGTGSNNTVVDANSNNAFTITGSNAGSITGLVASFAGMQTLDDTSGSGSDTFTFNNNVNFNGTINGNGSDTLDYSAYGATHAIAATVSGANSGNVVANSITLNFTGINVIDGGADDDSFSIGNTGSIGTLNGNAGTNTLSYSGDTIAVSVNLTTTAATGVTSYSNITNFVGDDGISGTNSTLTGPAGTNTWTISGTNAGNINSSAYTFTGFGNLTGGAGNDTFAFDDTDSITGNLNGGAGTNTIDLSAYTGAVSVNLTTSTSTGVGGTFSNITNFVGDDGISGTSSTLTGPAGTNTWTISGTMRVILIAALTPSRALVT